MSSNDPSRPHRSLFPPELSRRVLCVAFAALLSGAVTCSFRVDDLHCEEAAAHLTECCPELESYVLDCSGERQACESEPTITFTQQESDCLLERDCDTLARDRVCERFVTRAPGEPLCP